MPNSSSVPDVRLVWWPQSAHSKVLPSRMVHTRVPAHLAQAGLPPSGPRSNSPGSPPRSQTAPRIPSPSSENPAKDRPCCRLSWQTPCRHEAYSQIAPELSRLACVLHAGCRPQLGGDPGHFRNDTVVGGDGIDTIAATGHTAAETSVVNNGNGTFMVHLGLDAILGQRNRAGWHRHRLRSGLLIDDPAGIEVNPMRIRLHYEV